MKLLKERKTPLQSKRNVATMMNLYEKYVDEPIETIDIVSGIIKGSHNSYVVNISHNNVYRVYPYSE